MKLSLFSYVFGCWILSFFFEVPIEVFSPLFYGAFCLFAASLLNDVIIYWRLTKNYVSTRIREQ